MSLSFLGCFLGKMSTQKIQIEGKQTKGPVKADAGVAEASLLI